MQNLFLDIFESLIPSSTNTVENQKLWNFLTILSWEGLKILWNTFVSQIYSEEKVVHFGRHLGIHRMFFSLKNCFPWGYKNCFHWDTKTVSIENTKTVSIEDTKTVFIEDTKTVPIEDTKTISIENTKTVSLEDTKTASLQDTKTASLQDTKTSFRI